MYTNLNGLQDAWRGGAATQFTSVSAQWRAAQQQMEASLESIQQALTQASTVYADAEAQSVPDGAVRSRLNSITAVIRSGMPADMRKGLRPSTGRSPSHRGKSVLRHPSSQRATALR